MCILYSLSTNTLPHYFWYVATEELLLLCGHELFLLAVWELSEAVVFWLDFYNKSLWTYHACSFSFGCLVCVSSFEVLQIVVERHFLCHQTVTRLPINELSWVTSFFHCILCKLKLFCYSLKNTCDCCKLNDVIAVGMLASYLHPSFIVWYYFRHNLMA